MEEAIRKSIGKIAVESNNKVWSFFTQINIKSEDIILMLEAAYTSLHLWSIVGKDINIARGHWLLSRAQIVAGNSELAFVHAQKCEESTSKALEGREAFDLFYLNEAFARVYAMKNDFSNADFYAKKAKAIVMDIKDKETRDLCFSDLNSAPWFGFDLNS